MVFSWLHLAMLIFFAMGMLMAGRGIDFRIFPFAPGAKPRRWECPMNAECRPFRAPGSAST